ncbi:alpha/beta-hydrolase [Amniculicola lignicola CBS 123094]|uniref:Alpha/beta-hydrolase n=1 Tax=Amniculicola lignicola CBS 123094 TaxID=1392246 RepID=A0A6A5X176_9PLEO|nr:alpha/beta-hydrolase [Amniculicola lignicola CBS 123094]
MNRVLDVIAGSSKSPSSRLPLCLVVGAASLGSFAFLRAIRSSLHTGESRATLSPTESVLPFLRQEETNNLPYPPDALPGARDVPSPFGSIRVYEWGPEHGEKVLLIHGISTPAIALGGLADQLVEKGCRVMLFDLFNRGYSSGPSPDTHRYDSGLYTSQILTCLCSSPLPWTAKPFTIIGYSLGGALAADFTSYFPNLIRGLILVAPGGLIRTSHITWKSRLLYSSRGIIPEWLIHKMVAGRLWTGPDVARSIEPEPDLAAVSLNESKGGLRSQAVYTSSHTTLLPDNPNSTVGKVVDWQIQYHKGFVPAFVSTIRHAPIHEQQPRWRVVGENMNKGRCPLRRVDIILGETDPIIVAEEIVEDAKEVLGEEYLRVKLVRGSGHEVAIDRPDIIVRTVGQVFGYDDW